MNSIESPFLDKDLTPQDQISFAIAFQAAIKEIGKDQCMFIKRESIENNYLYEKDDLYPNIHYKDVTGTLSLYCKEKNLPLVVLKNSYNNRSLKSKHLLNLKNGEQAWVNGVPFFYHYGRGSVRKDNLYMVWVREAAKYLNLKGLLL